MLIPCHALVRLIQYFPKYKPLHVKTSGQFFKQKITKHCIDRTLVLAAPMYKPQFTKTAHNFMREQSEQKKKHAHI